MDEKNVYGSGWKGMELTLEHTLCARIMIVTDVILILSHILLFSLSLCEVGIISIPILEWKMCHT